jgi:phosphatidylserine/phosphatidylglycerophosphate/cardiolipin synthase-like enzyme
LIFTLLTLFKLAENHLSVPEKQYTSEKVKLPASEEIPNLDLQVINYHRPVFGTFHSKFVVIDRRLALLQSNNIQDNDNLEMMIRVEGPIVDSFYDTCLISWGKPLEPPLPMLNSPAASAPPPSFSTDRGDNVVDANGEQLLPEHTTKNQYYDPGIQLEAKRVNNTVKPCEGETKTQAVTRHLSMCSYQVDY